MKNSKVFGALGMSLVLGLGFVLADDHADMKKEHDAAHAEHDQWAADHGKWHAEHMRTRHAGSHSSHHL